MVTGAGSIGPGWGNGKATAVLFAREGARVFGVDIHLTAAEETRSIVEQEGGICTVMKADVSKVDDVRTMVERCVETFGRIDILHNNVGIVVVGGPVETDEATWDRVMAVNLKSMFLTCKYAVAAMLESGGGRAHNIALASLPNFTLPGDVSASKRYWSRDIIQPPVEVTPQGMIGLRDEPGFGYALDMDFLASVRVRQETFCAQ